MTPEELAPYMNAAYDNPAPRTSNASAILAHIHKLAVLGKGVLDEDGILKREMPKARREEREVRLPYREYEYESGGR